MKNWLEAIRKFRVEGKTTEAIWATFGLVLVIFAFVIFVISIAILLQAMISSDPAGALLLSASIFFLVCAGEVIWLITKPVNSKSKGVVDGR